MGVQDIDSVSTQGLGQPHHPEGILGAAPAFATKAMHSLSLHILPEPGRHRIQRREKHSIPCAVMPTSELREESAGIAILGKVQDVLHKMYNGRVGAGGSRGILLIYLCCPSFVAEADSIS